jgi:hypothetical protein
VNSLRHIRPLDGEAQQWQRRKGSMIYLQNPASEEALLTGETSRDEFEITGLSSRGDVNE